MALDYSRGCVNFRDVGEWVNCLAGRELLPVNRILRGGKLDAVRAAAEIHDPGTIVNLRNGPDPEDCRFGADYLHFPSANDLEKYDTTNADVRRWLNAVFAALATKVDRYPVLFHCTSGKDRTGVVVAVLLQTLGIEQRWIVDEYLLSDGGVHEELLRGALDAVAARPDYFARIDLQRLRERVMGR